MEDTGDLVHLKLSRFKELCLLRWYCDWIKLHALFEDCDTPAVPAAAVLCLPCGPQLLRIFQYPRML